MKAGTETQLNNSTFITKQSKCPISYAMLTRVRTGQSLVYVKQNEGKDNLRFIFGDDSKNASDYSRPSNKCRGIIVIHGDFKD